MANESAAPVVVAVDGPAGVGKSVAAAGLARALGFHYAPSGALYRAVGWLVEAHAVPLRDGDRMAALVAQAAIEIALRPGQSAVRVNGRDISEELAGEAVGRRPRRWPSCRRYAKASRRSCAACGARGAW